MTPRKILILGSGSLLDAGLYSLLSQLNHVEVLATKFTTIKDLIWTIDAFNPHTLVLVDETLFEIAPAIMSLIRSNSIRRTIIIHREENEIEVYDRNRIDIKALTDFLAML